MSASAAHGDQRVAKIPSLGRDVEERGRAMTGLYDEDFYAWTREQAKLLRQGRFTDADIANICEELDSMGRTEKRELASRLRVLLAHLLKWAYQPEARTRSWAATIVTQRADLRDHLADNPSLAARRDEVVAELYDKARRLAAAETGLLEEHFPVTCPWPFTQIVDDAFWPHGDGASGSRA